MSGHPILSSKRNAPQMPRTLFPPRFPTAPASAHAQDSGYTAALRQRLQPCRPRRPRRGARPAQRSHCSVRVARTKSVTEPSAIRVGLSHPASILFRVVLHLSQCPSLRGCLAWQRQPRAVRRRRPGRAGACLPAAEAACVPARAGRYARGRREPLLTPQSCARPRGRDRVKMGTWQG